MNLWFLEYIIYTINTTYSSPHSLFHWMFRCNVSHLPPATRNKRNYLGMGDTKKRVFFEGQTQSRSPKTLPPHPQVSGGLVSPQIQSRSPKAVYFFVFFLESRYLFFLLSRLNPKQLTQNVDMLRGEPRIWIYYVYGYTYDTRNYYCEQVVMILGNTLCKMVQTRSTNLLGRAHSSLIL